MFYFSDWHRKVKVFSVTETANFILQTNWDVLEMNIWPPLETDISGHLNMCCLLLIQVSQKATLVDTTFSVTDVFSCSPNLSLCYRLKVKPTVHFLSENPNI